MKIRVWGTRGSLASPGPRTVRYGGNTSCVGVTLHDGTSLALDAGSGIRELGVAIGTTPERPVHVLLTHLHMDHLQGLAFFAPLWSSGVDVHVWGPASTTQTLAERVATYMSPPLFPIHLDDIPSNLTFHDCPDEPFTIGDATVTAEFVSHQGPTVGYRIEEDGSSLAYVPDHEPAIGVELSSLGTDWLSGYALIEGVDVLFHDAQYFDDEYDTHVGWGHSAVSHVVALAARAGAQQLVLFHHDPSHSDEDLERLLVIACDLWGDESRPPILAYEGMEVDLAATRPSRATPFAAPPRDLRASR
jgi:phosphoribosyl 1,2-cyclic phosphodiesterase